VRVGRPVAAVYNGFVPYFMAKGARGLIGTECKTPALFAVEWANAFFDRFLDGAPAGETVLELRQEFLHEHGNPLGLIYAVHCDADTRITPALTPRRHQTKGMPHSSGFHSAWLTMYLGSLEDCIPLGMNALSVPSIAMRTTLIFIH
jgi:hypothetical protein